MTRFDEGKGKWKVGTGAYHDECLEGTSARTRSFSYKDIMLARKMKESKTNKDSDTGVADIPAAEEISFHSQEIGIPVNKSSLGADIKHIRHLKREGRWRTGDSKTLRKNEKNRDKHVGSRGSDIKLKSIVEKNFSSDTEHGTKPGRLQPRVRDKGAFLNSDHFSESDKKHSSSLMNRDRVPERIKEKSRVRGREHHSVGKELSRKRKKIEPRNIYPEKDSRNRSSRELMHAEKLQNQVRDIPVKKRHTHHNEVGSIKGRVAGKKYDSEKKQVDLSQAHFKESHTGSRDHVNEKIIKSHSPKLPKPAIIDKGYHREVSPSINDKLQREHSYAEKKRVFTAGSGSHYRHNSGPSSGLGGYSPRKRKTDAGGTTPSPTHRSPEKRNAGWDLQPSELQETVNDENLSSVKKLTLSSNLSNIMLPSGTPLIPVPVKPIHHAFALPMQATKSVQLTEATRPMRRLYVDNLPASASEKDLIEGVNQLLLSSGVNHIRGAQPCISCIRHKDKGQGLLEFLTPEDASAALTLKGFSFLGSNLIFRRPKDYATITTVSHDKSMIPVDSISDIVEDSPHKIFIGGISKIISSEMLLDIARAFGTVKAFHFKLNDEISEPYAFLEYVDHSVTSKACAGLNGLRLGGKVLVVVFATPNAVSDNFGKPPFYGIPEHAKPLLEKSTSILKLKNVLDPEHLSSMAEPELEAMLEDIKLECSRFGVVKSINIVKTLHSSRKTEVFGVKNENASINGCSSRTRDLPARVVESEEPNRSESLAAPDESETIVLPVEDNHSDDTSDDTLMKDARGERLSEGTIPPPEGLSCCENSGNFAVAPEIEIENECLDDKETNSEDKEMRNIASLLHKTDVKKVINDTQRDLSRIFEVGSVFVEYKRSESACSATQSLHGRTFDGRVVSAGYIDDELYRMRFRS